MFRCWTWGGHPAGTSRGNDSWCLHPEAGGGDGNDGRVTSTPLGQPVGWVSKSNCASVPCTEWPNLRLRQALGDTSEFSRTREWSDQARQAQGR